ncbi:LamG-like jellyroll fold domain-containing protein [Verrucomicrobiota bacterium sgz303538]
MERLDFLLNRYFDQALSADEKQELERVLLDSAEAREAFWQLSQWHGAIRQWAEEECGRREVVEALPAAPPLPKFRVLPSPECAPAVVNRRSKPAQQTSNTSGWWRPLAAAAVLAIGFFAWMQWKPGNRVNSEKGGMLARLSHTSSAVWADDASHNDGETLRGGTLKLKSGALQIDFSQGARVVLEGPAELELLSANSGALHHGKLIATVPESAHGFSVRTPSFSIADYGTQFGCIVPPAATPEVHVFQGAVGLKTAAKATRELRENQAVRLAGSQLQEIPANLNTFLTEEKLARLENARMRLDTWRRSSRAFTQHPGMLVHFDFEKDSGNGTSRTLINRAPNALPATNGTIEGCEWAEGRWPGKNALRFSGSNDRVRLSFPGEYPAMTFVAFLRTERTPNRENSLIQAISQVPSDQANWWYISGEGALGWSARVAPRGSAKQWLRIFSAPVFSGEVLNSWHMAATVFDGTKVTHYLDGKEAGSGSARLPAQIRLDRVEVGNGIPIFGPREPSEMTANFVGSIDELAILSVPLSSEQIQRLWEQGRPGGN